MSQRVVLTRGRTQVYTHVRLIRMTHLSNVDEEPDSVALVPVSTVIVVMVVLMVLVLPIPKAILVVVPLMSAPIIRPYLTGSPREKSGKENGHGHQHFAVMPQDYIFHSAYDRWFDKPL